MMVTKNPLQHPISFTALFEDTHQGKKKKEKEKHKATTSTLQEDAWKEENHERSLPAFGK